MSGIIRRSWGIVAAIKDVKGGHHTVKLDSVVAPSFAIGTAVPASQAEGNSGGAAFSFPVTRSVRLDLPATVDWAVSGAGGDPTSAGDFTGPISGTLGFAAGETLKTISVNAKGDLALEADETFQVTLSNPSVGTITSASATAIIANDDSIGGGGGSTAGQATGLLIPFTKAA